jgi:hypothetical protein
MRRPRVCFGATDPGTRAAVMARQRARFDLRKPPRARHEVASSTAKSQEIVRFASRSARRDDLTVENWDMSLCLCSGYRME